MYHSPSRAPRKGLHEHERSEKYGGVCGRAPITSQMTQVAVPIQKLSSSALVRKRACGLSCCPLSMNHGIGVRQFGQTRPCHTYCDILSFLVRTFCLAPVDGDGGDTYLRYWRRMTHSSRSASIWDLWRASRCGARRVRRRVWHVRLSELSSRGILG